VKKKKRGCKVGINGERWRWSRQARESAGRGRIKRPENLAGERGAGHKAVRKRNCWLRGGEPLF